MLEIVLLLVVFVLIPSTILFVGYRKFKRKMVTETTKAVLDGLPDPDSPVILHGHDLAKWNYLGHTRCQYIDEHDNITGEYPIFLFASKTDLKRRSYHVTNEYVAKNHSFINKFVKPWAVGEGAVYALISGQGNKPSDFLKEYMLENFSADWDTETKWWGQSDKAKYESAQTKQKKQRKPKVETQTENNVVTVEFGKQA